MSNGKAALTVHTPGISTRLSILAFATTSVPQGLEGRLFMVVAMCETLGGLCASLCMPPIYQRSLKVSSHGSGLLFYVDAVTEPSSQRKKIIH